MATGSDNTFTGDRKVPLKSPLAGVEKKFIAWAVPRVPRSIEGYHLTLTRIAWTAGLFLFGWLAARDLRWLWGSSAMFFLQWLTDCLDGALGRHRDTGIPKWGFYMDHLLDYVFMSAAFLQYLPLAEGSPRSAYLLIAWMLIYGALMASSWLAFASTGEFKITFLGVGPTEVCLMFIVLNTLMIFCGPLLLWRLLPFAVPVSFVMCCVIVYRAQRRIWSIDMEQKRAREPGGPRP